MFAEEVHVAQERPGWHAETPRFSGQVGRHILRHQRADTGNEVQEGIGPEAHVGCRHAKDTVEKQRTGTWGRKGLSSRSGCQPLRPVHSCLTVFDDRIFRFDHTIFGRPSLRPTQPTPEIEG